MRQSVLFLIIGLLLGYIIGQKEKPAPIAAATVAPVMAAPPATVSVPSAPIASAPVAVAPPAPLVQSPARTFITHHQAPHVEEAKRAPAKSTVDLTLNEENISFLEQNWLSLRDQAWTIARDGGWEIHFKEHNSIFKTMGFQDGDFVTADNIRSVFQNVDSHKQVERLVNIFNEILQ